MKIAIYTAIYGGYDSLKEQPVQSIACDYICFTDNPDLKSDTWKIKVSDVANQHPRMKAKYFKIMSHDVLPEYDLTVWIDGSAQILTTDFVKDLITMAKKDKLMVFRHPENRDCIYQEAEYCKDMPKYRGLPIMDQVRYYQMRGYPEHNGLMACGLVYRTNDLSNVQFNNAWWEENKMWTYQDQLSFPYCLWKLSLNAKIIELDQYDNYLINFKGQHSNLL